MKATIISSSTRADSESKNVSEYLATAISNLNLGEGTVIDLYDLNLPMFDTTTSGEWTDRWSEVSKTLSGSDAFIFVSPEWAGMMSAGLINFFHYTEQELADKPVYLVGVSSGRGGRYPLLQMRMMGYKNKHFVIIPESIFVDDVKNNLVDGEMVNTHIQTRATYGLKTLSEYAKALHQVRMSGVTDYENFGNGW